MASLPRIPKGLFWGKAFDPGSLFCSAHVICIPGSLLAHFAQRNSPLVSLLRLRLLSA